MADDDEVLALSVNIVNAGYGERNVASVSEPRVHLELQLLSVHAGRLRMYGKEAMRRSDAEHAR